MKGLEVRFIKPLSEIDGLYLTPTIVFNYWEDLDDYEDGTYLIDYRIHVTFTFFKFRRRLVIFWSRWMMQYNPHKIELYFKKKGKI